MTLVFWALTLSKIVLIAGNLSLIHIFGDDNWKDAACEMLQEMLLQNRNHPSIILWGVRINESVDDDAFYTLSLIHI